MATYITTIFGETYSIRADFRQAAAAIERDTADGHWAATGRQVADFSHRPEQAMQAELERIVLASGDDPADYAAEIAEAVKAMQATD